MNCSNCGATNDADARFCAECGAPLENQDVEATMAGQEFFDADNDETILSTPDMLAAEEAKTLNVDQAVLADVQENDDAAPSEPEPTPPPAVASSTPTGITDDDGHERGGDGQDGGSNAAAANGGNRRIFIIIGAVFLLVILCCCCCSIAVGTQIDPNNIEDLLRDFALLPTYLPFVA